MDGYTKLFGSIIHSTIWQESLPTKVVWVTMLAMADKNGEVMASVPGLAKAAGVTIAEAETALQRFLEPDPYSRTPENEGRRIEAIDGGWLLLNYLKHKQLMSIEDRREKDRERQQKHRSGCHAPVTPVSRDVTPVTTIEKEIEKENKEQKQGASAFVLPDWVPVKEWDAFIEQRKKLRKAPTDRAKELLVRRLSDMMAGGWSAKELIEEATLKGWQSFYAPKGRGEYKPPVFERSDYAASKCPVCDLSPCNTEAECARRAHEEIQAMEARRLNARN